MKLFTIGFTKKTAEAFFHRLRDGGVKRLVDVRLNNVSQLAGFAKKDDLRFFLRELYGIDYLHRTDLAPTQEMLDAYKKHKGDWGLYERQFLELLRSRQIGEQGDAPLLDHDCLLCSEAKPEHCHRRLVAEYLKEKWGNVEIEHLP
jgi:uncharacterized protein (DUF488 family)